MATSATPSHGLVPLCGWKLNHASKFICYNHGYKCGKRDWFLITMVISFLLPSHQFTWNLTFGGSWKTIFLLKGFLVRFRVRGAGRLNIHNLASPPSFDSPTRRAASRRHARAPLRAAHPNRCCQSPAGPKPTRSVATRLLVQENQRKLRETSANCLPNVSNPKLQPNQPQALSNPK